MSLTGHLELSPHYYMPRITAHSETVVLCESAKRLKHSYEFRFRACPRTQYLIPNFWVTRKTLPPYSVFKHRKSSYMYPINGYDSEQHGTANLVAWWRDIMLTAQLTQIAEHQSSIAKAIINWETAAKLLQSTCFVQFFPSKIEDRLGIRPVQQKHFTFQRYKKRSEHNYIVFGTSAKNSQHI